MEYLIVLIINVVAIVIVNLVFNVNIKKIKKEVENKKLDEIVSKFPENEEICKNILKKLNNEKVKVKKNEESKDKTSLYVAISDTIFIANIKDSYTRIQTIAHECLHSIQDRRILLFNFYYSNVYLIYFIVSIVLTVFGILKNYNLQTIILLLMGIIYYVIRSYLEMDAMIKAKYLAKDYMEEYIKNNEICSKNKVTEIADEYDKINKIGIPTYNFILLKNVIIKVLVYNVVALIVNLVIG